MVDITNKMLGMDNILILTKCLYICKNNTNMVIMVNEKPKPKIIRHINRCKGQVRLTIPKDIADQLGWQNKDVVEIKEKNGEVTVVKI